MSKFFSILLTTIAMGCSHYTDEPDPIIPQSVECKIKTFKDQASADANIKAKGKKEFKVRGLSNQKSRPEEPEPRD